MFSELRVSTWRWVMRSFIVMVRGGGRDQLMDILLIG